MATDTMVITLSAEPQVDPRQELMALLGAAGGVSTQDGYVPSQTTAAAAFAGGRAADQVPVRVEYREPLLDACRASVYGGLIAETQDDQGNARPGRALGKMRRYTLPGDGMLAFKDASGRVVEQVTGVPLRVKPYRQLWGKNAHTGKMVPKCASLDHQWGYGDPGGDCEICPAKPYQGRGFDYCRSKTRVYLVGKSNDAPVIFELTAMAREGLEDLGDWCRANKWPLHRTVIRLGLTEHPRQMGDFRSALAQVTLVGVLPADAEVDAAAALANEALDLMERAWMFDIRDSVNFRPGGDASRLDSTQFESDRALPARVRPVLDEAAVVVEAPAPPVAEPPVPVAPTPDPFAPDGDDDADDELAF